MKKVLFWALAILITFGTIVYQRATGPTYDKKVNLTIDGEEYRLKLIRSHGGETDCPVVLYIPDRQVSGSIHYRMYPTNNPWEIIEMERFDDVLSGTLPNLPPAGKYEYKVVLAKEGRTWPLNEGKPVIIRFKGDVPASILIPHIILMFFAMFLSNLAGIMAFFKHKRFRFYTRATLLFLFIGGLVFGPWVQLYAFGEAWAGIPFAWDLTDNKTLFMFLFWLLAFLMNRKKERPVYVIVASVVTLLMYAIPHSMYGSQLDPETGEIIQGWIRLFW